MINPTVETDLVGDLIEVSQRRYDNNSHVPYYRVVARGRCRAVTSRGSDLLLWLEMIDEQCVDLTRYEYLSSAAIGDVIAVCVSEGAENVFRLVRGETP